MVHIQYTFYYFSANKKYPLFSILQLIEMGLSGARQNVNGFQSFKSFSKTFVNMIKVEKSPKLVKGKTR